MVSKMINKCALKNRKIIQSAVKSQEGSFKKYKKNTVGPIEKEITWGNNMRNAETKKCDPPYVQSNLH
jgi:hypothetical protein